MNHIQHKTLHAVEKGIGDLDHLSGTGWNMLNEDISLPAAVIYQHKLQQNLNWMQSFANTSNVLLAPHGKTTMTPHFFRQQIKAGAWAITLASAPQVSNAHQAGIQRIIMANQLVGKFNMQLIANAISDPDFEFYCLVDSLDNVQQLGAFFAACGQSLNVLIEIGIEGGRCGCRNAQDARNIAQAIQQCPALNLVGIEFYEGVIHGVDAADKIKHFLNSIVHLTHGLIAQNYFSQERVLLTGAGSAWYDLVADSLSHAQINQRILPIIRPGCYLIHDTGIYQEAQNNVLSRGGLACDISGELVNSLEIWAYVLSIPQPGQAIIGMGKRDVAFDAGLPTPSLYYRPHSDNVQLADKHWRVSNIMDQHCFMQTPVDSGLKVGDMVSFSTSHPCLTMDKWRKVCIMDQQFTVRDVVDTYF